MIYLLGTRQRFEHYRQVNHLGRDAIRHIARVEDCYGIVPVSGDTIVCKGWSDDPYALREMRLRPLMRGLVP